MTHHIPASPLFGRLAALLSILLLLALLVPCAHAANEGEANGDKPKGPGQRAALVVTEQLTKGTVTPYAFFIGSTKFDRVARMATEVEGIVERVAISTGKRVTKGGLLVELNTDILDTQITASRAQLEETRARLEKARIDLQRIDKLYDSEVVSREEYDEAFYGERELANRAGSLEAQLNELTTLRAKKTVRAKFDGVVLEKMAEEGQWLSAGETIAHVGDDTFLEIIVNVPQSVLPWLEPGMAVPVELLNTQLDATFDTVIPDGDVTTRTVPVELDLSPEDTDRINAVAGLEVRVRLPIGKQAEALLIGRDALVRMNGQDMLWAVRDGAATPQPVEIVGYSGQTAGVRSPALSAGDVIVVRGNERLRPGQPVQQLEEAPLPPATREAQKNPATNTPSGQ